jgi:hypothetical protein
MTASSVSRIVVHLSRWSSTGNAADRPGRFPTPPVSLYAPPKYRVNFAQPTPTSPSGALDHTITAPHRYLSNLRATPKSP